MNTYSKYLEAIKNNDFESFKDILLSNKEKLHPKIHNYHEIFEIVKGDKLNYLVFLKEQYDFDLNFYSSKAFITACEENSIQIAKYYIENNISEPQIEDNWAIMVCAELGHDVLFEFLLNDPRTNPYYYDTFALGQALWNFGQKDYKQESVEGYLRVIELLLNDERIKKFVKSDEDLNDLFMEFDLDEDSVNKILNIKKKQKIKNF